MQQTRPVWHVQENKFICQLKVIQWKNRQKWTSSAFTLWALFSSLSTLLKTNKYCTLDKKDSKIETILLQLHLRNQMESRRRHLSFSSVYQSNITNSITGCLAWLNFQAEKMFPQGFVIWKKGHSASVVIMFCTSCCTSTQLYLPCCLVSKNYQQQFQLITNTWAWGKVPKSSVEPQASAEGNHDHPVSGNHQSPSHWNSQWKKHKILFLPLLTRREGRDGSERKALPTQ